MIYIFYVVLVLILLIFSTYTYFILKRIITNFFPDSNIKLIAFISTILCFIPIIITKLSNWLIFIFYFLFISFIIDIIIFMLTKIIKIKFKFYNIIFIIPIIISAIFTTYGIYNAHNIIKTEYIIKTTKNLNNNNYKFALISDVHYGKTVDINKLKEYIEEISRENPDFVILAGDIIDENTPVDKYTELFNELGKIKNKYGIYYIHGNHDESRYTNPTDNRNKKLMDAINSSNIKFLNESSSIINDYIILTGRIDYSYRNSGIRKKSLDLINELDKEKYLIVADHQPYVYKENKNAGYDLQVSGHTHTGQVWPFGIITSNIGFDYGKLTEDNFNLIVSSGFGVWGIESRTEEHSEYVIINISEN